MRNAIRWTLLCLLIGASGMSLAQSTNSGDIRGIVTDASGALIPAVKVTVLNVDTGVSKEYVTNNDGLYDTSSIVTGNYKVTFSKEGFEELVRGPVTLQVGLTTVNGQLSVGSITQSVVVSTDIPLLQTETGEQSTTLESKSMSQLPNVGQDWENFTILLPGTAGVPGGNQGATNPGQGVSANGNLPFSNVLADGASTTLPSSANSDISIFETVAEVQVSTSSFSAQYGVGGIIFNQISKSGTNQFHGSAYEYFQNDALNAKGYGFGNQISVPFLRYNNFGGSIGGPILKKKMFFYFNYDKTINNGVTSGFTTLPTPAMMAGDFTGQPTIYDPTTQVVTQGPNGPVVTRRSFADEYGNGNRIPANLIDPVAGNIQAFYPTPANHNSNGHFVPGTLDSVGIYENNYYYQFSSPSPFTKFFGRLDYDITSNNRLTLSDTQRDNAALTLSIFNCPVSCQLFDIDSNNAQVSDVWNISSRLINEARFGFTDQLNFFQPPSLGQGYPAKLGLQFAKADVLPNVNINGNGNCCTNGNAGIGPGTSATYKEMAFDPSDVVTMIRGKHILHFGGELLFYRDDATTWGNIKSSTLQFNGNYTQSTVGDGSTGVAYADFLLGQMQHWDAQVQPEYGARLKTPQMFVQDDIKLKPNLTLNLGLRYQIQHGWNEVKKNISVFDPTVTNPATGTSGAFWYAATAANGRTALQANIYNTFLPRAGFSWLPQANTTIRGAIGLYAYNYSLDNNGNGLGNSFNAQGSIDDQTNGITPVAILSGSGANLPFSTPNNNPAAFAGQNIPYNDYHTPLGKSLQWNVAVQRGLGSNMVGEIAYVASHGYNLPFNADINQVPVGKLGPNDNPADRPYPYWGNISSPNGHSNSISNYHSLQASISKRLTSGISFNFNYTWSHFLDDMDSSGWGSHMGPQTYQNAYDPSANYGASNFDIRNAFKGNAVYQLPFGRGKTFLNNNTLLDLVVGGWQASGTMILLDGQPFTPTINQNNSFAQGNNSAWYPNVIGNPRLDHRNYQQWYNPAAFTSPANGTFGNMRRNSLNGPGVELVNLSAGKTFTIWEEVKLQIRADATNAFNHTNLAQPSTTLACTAPGQPCSSSANISGIQGNGRQMQLGARFSF
jgi:hypothetical protein